MGDDGLIIANGIGVFSVLEIEGENRYINSVGDREFGKKISGMVL